MYRLTADQRKSILTSFIWRTQGNDSRNATWKEHHMTGKMGLFEFEEIEVTNAWGTLPEGLRNFV